MKKEKSETEKEWHKRFSVSTITVKRGLFKRLKRLQKKRGIKSMGQLLDVLLVHFVEEQKTAKIKAE